MISRPPFVLKPSTGVLRCICDMFEHLIYTARPYAMLRSWDPDTDIEDILPPKVCGHIVDRAFPELPWMYSLSAANQEWARYKSWALRVKLVTNCLNAKSRMLMSIIQNLHHGSDAPLLSHLAPLSDVYKTIRHIRSMTVLGALPIEHLVMRNMGEIGFRVGAFNLAFMQPFSHKLQMRTFFINDDLASVTDAVIKPYSNPLFDIVHMRQSTEPSPLVLQWYFDHLALLVAVEDVPPNTFLFIPKPQAQS